jgi:hypothetical protein
VFVFEVDEVRVFRYARYATLAIEACVGFCRSDPTDTEGTGGFTILGPTDSAL